MTGDARDPLYLIPPPGPLTWLYPELAVLESSGTGEGEVGPEGVRPDRVWDLGRMVPARGGLVDAVLAAKPSSVHLPDGPRGRALETWLGPRLRDAGVPIEWDRSRRADGRLEAKLAAIAVSTPPGTLARLPESGGHGTARPGSDGWRLLPLPGDPQALINSILDVQASFSTRRVIPYFVTRTAPDASEEPGGDAVETRLPLSWWGLLPGDRYPRQLRIMFRELVRQLHPGRYLRFLTYENLALAGVDLWGEVVAGRFRAWPPESSESPARPSGSRPLIVGIDGIDGAGKSSLVAAARELLEARGLQTAVHKIYRHGVFHDTVTDLTRSCAGDKNLHLWRIQRVVKAFDSVKYFFARVEPDLARCDALIFDRYVPTHHAAGRGRFHHDPFTHELLSVYPPADRIYLIDLPVEDALERIGQRPERTVDENPYMLGRFRHALEGLAERGGFTRLDGRASRQENQRILREDLLDLVVRWRKEGGRG